MNNKLIIGCSTAAALLLSACNSTETPKTLVEGEISLEELKVNYPLFEANHHTFSITDDEKQRIKQWPKNIRIEVYFGTWCHDSQREVPRLLTLLEHNTAIDAQLIALDYQKSDPQGKALANKIKFTPTFIVYRGNDEIGRIIERPKVSLVADVTSFINRT